MVQRIPLPPRVAQLPMPVRGSQSSGLGDALLSVANGLSRAQDADRQADDFEADVDHQIAVAVQRQADDALYLEAKAEQARIQGDQALQIEEYRQSAAPGGEGHREAIAEMLNESSNELDELIGTNNRVRARIVGDQVNYNQRILAREGLWEKDRFFERQGRNVERYMEASGNALVQDPSPELFETTIEGNQGVVDMLRANDDVKAETLRKLNRASGEQLLTGLLANGKWEEAQKLLDAGFFNQMLPDIAPWLSRVSTERNRAAAAAEAEAASQREAAIDQLKLYREQTDAGILVEASDVANAVAAARAAGVSEDELVQYSSLAIDSDVNRRFMEASPAQVQAAMYPLKAKVLAGTATGEEQLYLKQLGKLYEGKLDDHASMTRKLLQQGVAGRLQAIEAAPRDEASRYDSLERAEQGLGAISLLQPVWRGKALSGREALSQNPEIIDQKKSRALFRQDTVTVASGMKSAQLESIRIAADGIYAQNSLELGRRTFDPDLYRTAITLASGARRRDGKWTGGIQWFRSEDRRNYSLVLPDGWTMAEFQSMLARQPYTDARYADGSEVKPADIYRNYTPVFVGYRSDGKRRYGLRDAQGRMLSHKDGTDFRLFLEDRD